MIDKKVFEAECAKGHAMARKYAQENPGWLWNSDADMVKRVAEYQQRLHEVRRTDQLIRVHVVAYHIYLCKEEIRRRKAAGLRPDGKGPAK